MERYKIDHDYHIHSYLSACSSDPEQSFKRILKYAEDNGFKDICLADHFWDDNVPGATDWYKPQNYEHLKKCLPLPQGEISAFHFGCETDVDKDNTIGISEKMIENFEFIVISTTHLHMTGFTVDEKDSSVERRAFLYLDRIRKLMEKDLPFEKIGIAHLVCADVLHINDYYDHLEVFNRITDEEYTDVFKLIAGKKAGFEINMPIDRYKGEQREQALRPLKIAKKCGCKFYLGSDAHHPAALDAAYDNFSEIVNALDLTEEDKFKVFNN